MLPEVSSMQEACRKDKRERKIESFLGGFVEKWREYVGAKETECYGYREGK